MKVEVLFATNSRHRRRIESAVALVNGCQTHFRLTLTVDDNLMATGERISPVDVCARIEAARPDDYLIAVSEDLFDDNWFSHEYRTSSLITVGDWEAVFAPPSLKSYLMYQIAQALLHFASDMSLEMALNTVVHEPPVGCANDLSANKADIKLGMVAGNICAQCAAQLRALGIDEEALEAASRVLSMVRNEALGRPMPLDPRQVFVVMRFSENDENDNAWKYGIRSGIEGAGYIPVRGDWRVEPGHILDKVTRLLARSRLVVAKVDESNLNVYFELGFAMGVEKDVLLISDSGLVLDLPSDLRGWECLTYPRGDYGALATAVTTYIEAKFGKLPIA